MMLSVGDFDYIRTMTRFCAEHEAVPGGISLARVNMDVNAVSVYSFAYGSGNYYYYYC